MNPTGSRLEARERSRSEESHGVPDDDGEEVKTRRGKMEAMLRENKIIVSRRKKWYKQNPLALAAGAVERTVASSMGYANDLADNFGWRFMILLTSAYFGVKGTLYTFVMSGQLPYFQKYVGASGQEYQKYRLASSLPWAMKAWIGMISDNVPIFGYHKSGYLWIGAAVGSASFFLLGTVEITSSTATLAALLFFLASLDIATTDLLCEGQYASLMVDKPETSSDLVSWVWGVYHMGTLLASCFIGPVSDALSPKVLYLICIPFALQFLVPLSLGYLGEKKVRRVPKGEGSEGKAAAAVGGKIRQNPKLFALAFLTAALALGMGATTLKGSETVMASYALGAAVVLCVCSTQMLPKVLSNCNIYMFLCEVLYIQVSGAVDYFYTADRVCLDDSPHFDYTYYNTYSQVVGAVAGWFGVILFQSIMRDWPFRKVFWFTTVIRGIGAIFDIVIAKRWNTHILGISDKWMYLFGDAIVYNIVYSMNFMPAVVLTSKVCPKGMESTVYALLAGFQNMGQNVSQTFGVFLIDMLGIRTLCNSEGERGCDCTFENLPALLAVCHLALPMLTIPLTFILIPKVKMTDSLMGLEGMSVGVEDSKVPYETLVEMKGIKTEDEDDLVGSPRI